MITEDYVSFETAKLLKEKGFDEKCHMCWDEITKVIESADEYATNSELLATYISAPTLQMAVKWLREEKGIAIIPVLSSILDNEKFLWDIKIVVAKTGERYSQGWIYEKQEEAFDTAIKYCLESLI